MNLIQATEFALAKGATQADIEAEAKRQKRHVGTVPFRNMIVALQLHPWSNSRDEWVRLAGAMKARRMKRA